MVLSYRGEQNKMKYTKLTGIDFEKLILVDRKGKPIEFKDYTINLQERYEKKSFKKFFYNESLFYKEKPKFEDEKIKKVNFNIIGKELKTIIMLLPKIDRFNRTLLTIEEFAEEIGTTRQTMSKILHKLEESNLICLRPPKMIVINPHIFNSGSMSTMEQAKQYWHESVIKKQGKTKSIRKSLD